MTSPAATTCDDLSYLREDEHQENFYLDQRQDSSQLPIHQQYKQQYPWRLWQVMLLQRHWDDRRQRPGQRTVGQPKRQTSSLQVQFQLPKIY